MAKDNGHKRKCSPKKKNVFKKPFQTISKKKPSKFFFRQSPEKDVFEKYFQAFHKILTIQKVVLSSSRRGQANFRGLEASRPRTSKCVLEDVLDAKDVLEDSTSGNNRYQSSYLLYATSFAIQNVFIQLILSIFKPIINFLDPTAFALSLIWSVILTTWTIRTFASILIKKSEDSDPSI